MRTYYFDTLPIHPQPEPLESLTSYVTRLADANEIRSTYHVKKIFFPNRGASAVRRMADLPLATYDALPTLAACSETVLRATTFYYMASNFARSTSPQAVNQFLDGCLARRLRYCPLCLQSDQPYYSLAWRFLTLPGCPQHGCRFLDCCPQCGQQVDFLPTSLKIGVCPECGAALSSGRTDSLEPQELEVAQAHYRDLVFLLVPRPPESEPVAVGPRLAYWRQVKQLTTEDVARQIGRTVVRVRILERSVLNHGTRFQYYLEYANLLGLTLEEIFNTVVPPEAQIRGQFSRQEMRQYREEELVRRAQEAIETLRAQGQPLLQLSVCKLVGRSLSTLNHYPRVKAILKWVAEEHRRDVQRQHQLREQELVLQVEQIIANLQTEGRLVTLELIAKQVGMTQQAFHHYPQVKAILAPVVQQYQRTIQQQRERRVQEWTEQAKQAISQLESENRPVTKTAVAQLLGHAPVTLDYHPSLKALLVQDDQNTAKSAQSLEMSLSEKVQEVINYLQAQDRPVTYTAISQLVHPQLGPLARYPELAWIVGVCEQDKQKRKQQRKQAMAAKLLQAMKELKAQGEPISQKDISTRAGLPPYVFQDFPDLRAQVAVERQHSKQEQEDQRAQTLLTKVEQAIADLSARGVPLTQAAIGRQVSCSVENLRSYPQVHARLQELVQDRQAEARRRKEERDSALAKEVQVAIEQLQSQGKPVTHKAIGRVIGMCPRSMGKYPRVRELLEQVSVEMWGRHGSKPDLSNAQ